MRDTAAMAAYAPSPPQQHQFTAGEWMRAIRAAYGYSRRQFSEHLGVEPEQLQKWEQRDKIPNKKKHRRVLNSFARHAGLPELAFSFDPVEAD